MSSATLLHILLEKIDLLQSEKTQLSEELTAERCRRLQAEKNEEFLRSDYSKLCIKHYFPAR